MFSLEILEEQIDRILQQKIKSVIFTCSSESRNPLSDGVEFLVIADT